jgi:hypothetical protein
LIGLDNYFQEELAVSSIEEFSDEIAPINKRIGIGGF